jgi:Tfp pilus assembly protein PilV
MSRLMMQMTRNAHSARGLTVLEVVVAMAILTFAVIMFGSAMVAATDAEAKAGEHTQAIMIGNYLIEFTRRDPHFWDNNPLQPIDEWSGPLCAYPANCWPKMDPSNVDQFGVTLPPYADSLALPPGPGTWHQGFAPPDSLNVVLPPYHYIWRADPIDQSKFSGTRAVASVTIELYVDADGPQDVYTIKGLNRWQ